MNNSMDPMDLFFSLPLSNPCNGLAGLLFGHDLQPQYDEEQDAPVLAFTPITKTRASTLLKLLRAASSWKRTYRGSVCSRCGLTISVTGAVVKPGPKPYVPGADAFKDSPINITTVACAYCGNACKPEANKRNLRNMQFCSTQCLNQEAILSGM